MTVTNEVDKAAEWLLPFYIRSSSADSLRLNIPLRKCLRLLAAQHALQFKQDNAGNIYLSSPGRDPQLPPIGICFPLDDSKSPEAFEGALRAFFALKSCSLICGILLTGWSFLKGKNLGHDIWSGRSAAEEIYSVYPDLEQFSLMTAVAEFSMCATFEIVKLPSRPTYVRGSPILIQKAEEAANADSGVFNSTAVIAACSRAPEIRIEGDQAIQLGISTIHIYCGYIQAIFDNFD